MWILNGSVHYFSSHCAKLVKNYDSICVTKMANASLNITRILRNGDLDLIPAAFGAYFFLSETFSTSK